MVVNVSSLFLPLTADFYVCIFLLLRSHRNPINHANFRPSAEKLQTASREELFNCLIRYYKQCIYRDGPAHTNMHMVLVELEAMARRSHDENLAVSMEVAANMRCPTSQQVNSFLPPSCAFDASSAETIAAQDMMTTAEVLGNTFDSESSSSSSSSAAAVGLIKKIDKSKNHLERSKKKKATQKNITLHVKKQYLSSSLPPTPLLSLR